jgi:hypothetical protein
MASKEVSGVDIQTARGERGLKVLSGSLSQPAKTLGPSYYCLYSLFNKIRDKGKIVSAW